MFESILIILLFTPFIVLTILANLADRYQGARILTYLGLILINLFLLLAGILVALVPVISRLGGPQAAPDVSGGLSPASGVAMGLVIMATGLVGFLPLLPPVRHGLARLIPINPDATVDATALVLAVYLTGSSLTALWVVPSLSQDQSQVAGLTPTLLWTQELIFALLGALGVGLFVRRSGRDTLGRLKLGGLSLRPLLVAAGAVAGLLAFSWVISEAWNLVNPASYQEVGRISQVLFGGLTSPFAVLSLGLAAGIGEETLFRGALQPRFGLLLTALLFMVAHTQYTISPALLEVFVVGWVLGVIHDRSNTTVCILLHAAYNILSVVLAPLFP